MEMMSEQERFENCVLPRDIVFDPTILALQALIEQMQNPEPTEA